MEQNKMTPTPWKVEIEGDKFPAYSITTDAEEGTNNTVCNLFTATMGEKAHQEVNAFAIVSAINNTYGAGINPVAIPDLLNALNSIAKHFFHEGNNSHKSLGLQSIYKAAIEKAKL